MEEKVKELFSDKTFIEKICKFETPEEVQACLAENDIELSIDDIEKAKELIVKKVNGELTDTDLEKVSGGLCGVALALIIGLASALSVAGGVTSLTLTGVRW